jgi:hypothetical protein
MDCQTWLVAYDSLLQAVKMMCGCAGGRWVDTIVVLLFTSIQA